MKDDNKRIDRLRGKYKRSRSERTEIGQLNLNMTVDEGVIPSGHVGRWVNDSGGRLEKMLLRGWDFVRTSERTKAGKGEDKNTDLGSYVSMVVDKEGRNGGELVRAYLMSVPTEIYENDQKTKQKRVDEIDDMIHKGKYKVSVDNDKFQSDIKYTH